ncbi:MAG TPA: RDD family protein [Euzebyales bacterium]
MFDEHLIRPAETDAPPRPHLTPVPDGPPRPLPTTAEPDASVEPQPVLRPATPGARVGAYIIDCLSVTLPLAIAGALSGVLPVSAEGLGQGAAYAAAVTSAIVLLIYFATAEAVFGRTLGKRLLRCAVIAADGGPVTLRAALLRRVVFVGGLVVPMLGPLLAFAAPLAMLVTVIQDAPTGRGFHDQMAGTLVVDR